MLKNCHAKLVKRAVNDLFIIVQSAVAAGEGEVFVGGEYLFYKAVKSFELIRPCGGAHRR